MYRPHQQDRPARHDEPRSRWPASSGRRSTTSSGFRRLGYDAYYVEAHAPHAVDADGDATTTTARRRAAAFIDGVMRPLRPRRPLGLPRAARRRPLLRHERARSCTRSTRSAALIINLHGGTEPLPEHAATGRLVYLETDPVAAAGRAPRRAPGHASTSSSRTAPSSPSARTTAHADCGLPVSDRFHFHPTRQPVVLDLWRGATGRRSPATCFTTVGNWRQRVARRHVRAARPTRWSKHHEFLKFLDLPAPHRAARSSSRSRSYDARGPAAARSDTAGACATRSTFSTDLDAYRDYIAGSRGEFTVAKDQNVRLRSGWFSDRSATLPRRRPAGRHPGHRLRQRPARPARACSPFSTMDELLAAVEAINADYERHCRGRGGAGARMLQLRRRAGAVAQGG